MNEIQLHNISYSYVIYHDNTRGTIIIITANRCGISFWKYFDQQEFLYCYWWGQMSFMFSKKIYKSLVGSLWSSSIFLNTCIDCCIQSSTLGWSKRQIKQNTLYWGAAWRNPFLTSTSKPQKDSRLFLQSYIISCLG